jgi:hypothetical protein
MDRLMKNHFGWQSISNIDSGTSPETPDRFEIDLLLIQLVAQERVCVDLQ